MVEIATKEEKEKKEEMVGEPAKPPVYKYKKPEKVKKEVGPLFKRKKVKKEKKLFNYVLGNLLLIIFGIFWIDYLGLINVKEHIFPILTRVPVFRNIILRQVEDVYLLSREEYNKQQLAAKLYEEELKQKEKELTEKEAQLKSKEEEIEEAKKKVEEKDKKIEAEYNKYKNYQENIRLQAEYIVSMPPEDAVKRLNNMEDLLVIDILREIERKAQDEGKKSIVPYLLTLMDAERASQLQRKMTEE